MLLFVILVCAIASMANAAVYRYEGNGAWENASITEGWTLDNGATHPGVLPGAGDEPRMNWGGATVTVSSAVPTVFRVYPGCDEGGTLTVQNGGAVTMTDCLMMAVGGNPNTGILNVEAGGTVTAGGHLWVAENPLSVGILNISGTVSIGGIIGLGGVGFGAGGIGTVNVLDGGILHLSNIHGDMVNLPSIHAGSLIEITGTGLVTLPGDFVAVAQAYVDAGRIIGIVEAVYSGGVITQTNIVVPEPITLSLLSLGALLLRKRS